jgi:hypothetical protein
LLVNEALRAGFDSAAAAEADVVRARGEGGGAVAVAVAALEFVTEPLDDFVRATRGEVADVFEDVRRRE